jgi:dynein heavy chain
MDRCNDVLDLAEAVRHLSGLDRVAFGGKSGRMLTAGLKELHAEFMPAVAAFVGLELELLNIDAGKNRHACMHAQLHAPALISTHACVH